MHAPPYSVVIGAGRPIRVDWRLMVEEMVRERHDAQRVASRFHATLIEIAAAGREARHFKLV